MSYRQYLTAQGWEYEAHDFPHGQDESVALTAIHNTDARIILSAINARLNDRFTHDGHVVLRAPDGKSVVLEIDANGQWRITDESTGIEEKGALRFLE